MRNSAVLKVSDRFRAFLIIKNCYRMSDSAYKKRPIRFLKIIEHDGWKIKAYSISCLKEVVNPGLLIYAKNNLNNWLSNNVNYNFPNYKIATLILHEGKDGCFAVINWWVNENMLQQHVYFSSYHLPNQFKFYSDNCMFACTWELAILWFERNAWVENILMKPHHPDYEKYLMQQMNEEV